MFYFLSARSQPVGGDVAGDITVLQVQKIENANQASYATTIVQPAALQRAIASQNVLLATHGFHENQTVGTTNLYNWMELLDPNLGVFVGMLWPGDSTWLGALCYPAEGRHAMESGNLFAQFIDKTFSGVASLALASHSLGARVLLQTISKMSTRVKQFTLMAGAINDDCLVNEYASVAGKVQRISVLASTKDDVLAMAFPIGNIFEGIIDSRHPYWDGAIGRKGPSTPIPASIQGPWQIPDGWDYGHGDYIDDYSAGYVPEVEVAATRIAPQQNPPPQNTPTPTTKNWKPAWSAAIVSNRAK